MSIVASAPAPRSFKRSRALFFALIAALIVCALGVAAHPGVAYAEPLAAATMATQATGGKITKNMVSLTDANVYGEDKAEVTVSSANAQLTSGSDYSKWVYNDSQIGATSTDGKTIIVKGNNAYFGGVILHYRVISRSLKQDATSFVPLVEVSYGPMESTTDPDVKTSNGFSAEVRDLKEPYKCVSNDDAENHTIELKVLDANGDVEESIDVEYGVAELDDFSFKSGMVDFYFDKANTSAKHVGVQVYADEAHTVLLRPGKDYDYLYNVGTGDSGTFPVTIQGHGAFEGCDDLLLHCTIEGETAKKTIPLVDGKVEVKLETNSAVIKSVGEAVPPVVKQVPPVVKQVLFDGEEVAKNQYELTYKRLNDNKEWIEVTDEQFQTPGAIQIIVTGTNGYSGSSVGALYTLEKTDGVVISIDATEYPYDPNEARKPNVMVNTDGGEKLTQDTDYTVSYRRGSTVIDSKTGDFTTVGTITVAVQEAGVYEGSFYKELSYQIVPNDISKDKALSIEISNKKYTGSKIDPSVTAVKYKVSDGTTRTLKEDVDFKLVKTEGNTNVGTATVTLEGIGNYTGTVTGTFKITAATIGTSSADVTVSMSTSTVSYSGTAQKPSVTISKFANKALVEGTDYTIKYTRSGTATTDFTSAGSITVTVAGKGNFTGSVTKTYTISQRSITSLVSLASSTTTYSGKAQKPAVSATLNSKKLVEGTDYTVSYKRGTSETKDFTSAGTISITVNGKGNFYSTTTRTYTINTASVSTYATVSSIADQTYTGKALTPKVTVKSTLTNKNLVKDTDYTITYSNNTSVSSTYSTAYVSIQGKGNYSGTKTATFSIVGRPISGKSITVGAVAAQKYTCFSISPQLTVKNGKTTLKQGTDYTLSYANNTNPGKATITVTGTGTYAGTRTVKFTIKSTGTKPKVTANRNGSGRITLKWDPIYGASKYWIQEKRPDGSYYTLSKQWVTRSNSDYYNKYACDISNLSATRKHRFLVRAYVNGKWSSAADSNLVSIKPSGIVKPTVRGLSASNTSVQLTWSAVPGAEYYALYERQGKKGAFTLRTDTYTATSVTMTSLTKKQTYQYYVRAKIDGKWSKVTKSDYVTVSPSDPNPPLASAAAIAGKKGQVKLSWGKVRGATKYWVEAKAPNGKWKTYSKAYKKTTYTFKNLAKKKYTFRVRAYANGKWSKLYTDYYATATPDN